MIVHHFIFFTFCLVFIRYQLPTNVSSRKNVHYHVRFTSAPSRNSISASFKFLPEQYFLP
jgi:hypothetical protein